MLRNRADSKADVDRFVRRVVEADVVWYLTSPRGTAISFSNAEPEDGMEDEDPAKVILFFSDEAYAKRARAKSFPQHKPASMSLFDFLFRWLPGMTQDGVLAGPNWTADLIGMELDPYDLRSRISDAMTAEHSARHQALYRQLTGQQNEA